MAALHPDTVELLRRTLADLNTQHKRDMERLARLKVESKSKMAQKLRDRINESVPVMRDLERILPPVHDAAAPPTLLQTAYRVLGEIMETVPSDFTACGWDIDIRHSTGTRIKIQQAIFDYLNEAAIRQSIRSVATVLGLTYAEDRRDGRILIHAVGEIDGIDVEIWDAIEISEASR